MLKTALRAALPFALAASTLPAAIAGAATASTTASATPAAAASAAASASTPAIVALVRQRLQLAPVLQGEFEQSKTITGFRNPLVSHGDFVVARGQGVLWHTAKPFESTLVVTKTKLFTRAADGTTANALDAQAEPGLRQVNELVFALLAADLDTLAERFAIQGEAVGAQGWRITLTPRDAQLAKFLARATLEGGRNVDAVRIEETRGDATQIRFSHQAQANALTGEQAARFQ
jgi:hypothetical protein